MNFLTNIKKTDGNLQKLRDSSLKDLFEERTAYTTFDSIILTESVAIWCKNQDRLKILNCLDSNTLPLS